MFKPLFFVVTYLLSGLVMVAFFKTILEKHRKIINPAEILILGFGLGPIMISLILYFLFLFFPHKENSFYILIIGIIFLLMFFIGRKGIAGKGKKGGLKRFKEIRNQRKNMDIVIMVSIVGIVMLYIFIQGVNFSIVTCDASLYGYYGKYLYREKSLDNYPMKRPDVETGAYLPVSHPPALPLIYTWFYLLQGDSHSDILARTVSPMYSLYLIILLWIILRTRKGKYCAAWGTLLMVFTPLFVETSYINSIDPLRIYLIFLSFILLAKFLTLEVLAIKILTGVVAGFALYTHTTGVLTLMIIIILYLLLSRRNMRKRIISAAIIGLIAITIGGRQYGITYPKFKNLAHSLLAPTSVDSGMGEEVGEDKEFHDGRLQVFSRIELFGLSYYLFIGALFYWLRYIRKKRLDTVLLAGILLFTVPVIYKYWFSPRSIFTIHPLIIYFGGLTLGTIYGRLKERGREKRMWGAIFSLVLIVIIAFFAPGSIASRRLSSGKKMARYILSSKEKQMYMIHPIFEAIKYLNSQTPKKSIVLVFRAREYFYHSKRKGIWYRDPRMKDFCRLDNTRKAYQYLIDLGISHIMITPFHETKKVFRVSEVRKITENKEFSELVFEKNQAKVYRLKDA